MEIRQRMMERAPGITRIVDTLVRKELVHRSYPEADRRRVLCSLTRTGEKKLAELDPAIDLADLFVFSHLPPQELAKLTEYLRKTVEAVEAR